MANDLQPMAYDGIVELMAPLALMKPRDYVDTILQICFPVPASQPTDVQFAVFLQTCHQYGLNPLMKEVYGIKQKSGPIMPVVSIDGWLKMINSQPHLDGISFKDAFDKEGRLTSITCAIHRKDRKHPVEVTEYLSECLRPGDVWAKYPHRMLRHKALIQCARYAFAYSGVYEPDEAERIIEGELATAPVAPPIDAVYEEIPPPPAEEIPEKEAEPTQVEKAEKQAAEVSKASAHGAAQEYLKEDIEDAKFADAVVDHSKETDVVLDALEVRLEDAKSADEVFAIVEESTKDLLIGVQQEQRLDRIIELAIARFGDVVPDAPPPPEEEETVSDGAELTIEQQAFIALSKTQDASVKGLMRDAYKAGWSASKRVVPKAYTVLDVVAQAYRQGFDDHAEDLTNLSP